ncbi:hypothetical protein Tsubulata_040642 [Turnera subulata]|uniref:non-specific serine/threonine protein kinase n=1 Tax=Turnera subulata TaxID=218843 RepID=A0A9Q0GC41_9ROSI|nr:hypothetical protein Tsubulata_040642 [Turnera subulata]
MEPRTASPPPPPPPPPPSSSPKQPATLLNRYQLVKMLGRGSFAKVYAARSLADKKLVAIKVIDKASTDPAMEPRITGEISAMRRLQRHPNVLQIHEVMASKTKIYLVMELARGGDLFSQVVQFGKLKEPAARRFFQQLVSALHFCHQNGVAHRDVKPQNLLLDETGRLKVTDFGLSSLKNSTGGVLHTACGTPAFTAPEVMARKGYDGAKADAWSCGVILFFLLTARLPFDDSNLAIMYRKVQRREYQVPSFVSKSAKWVINQLLDPNPQTRMSLTALMNHSWFLKRYEAPARSSLFESKEYNNKCCYSKFDASVNAFDIISLSSGLDLSGLFEGGGKREWRFSSGETAEGVMRRVREVGDKLGYRVVEEGKGGVAIGLGRGKVVLVFEVFGIAEKLSVVDVKMVEGGGVEFEEVCWTEFEDEIRDVVVRWHNEVM